MREEILDKTSLERRNRVLRRMACVGLFACLGTMLFGAPLFAFASDLTVQAVGIIFKILRAICIVLGAFFVVFGVVKVAIAHASDNPQDQSKALIMSAVGLVLVLMGSVILGESMQTSVADMINSAIQ